MSKKIKEDAPVFAAGDKVVFRPHPTRTEEYQGVIEAVKETAKGAWFVVKGSTFTSTVRAALLRHA